MWTTFLCLFHHTSLLKNHFPCKGPEYKMHNFTQCSRIACWVMQSTGGSGVPPLCSCWPLFVFWSCCVLIVLRNPGRIPSYQVLCRLKMKQMAPVPKRWRVLPYYIWSVKQRRVLMPLTHLGGIVSFIAQLERRWKCIRLVIWGYQFIPGFGRNE